MTFAEYKEATIKFLRDLFSLDEDKANEAETVAVLKRGVEFKGINVWILIFAIFIASIGLNVNSTAVIIGAMLVSPLMGPIMGVGLSLGIYDFELFGKSMKNLSVMVVISILSSALYFFLSPLDSPTSELIARTSPTIWDVFIALFGGMAGIVAGSSKEKGNAIPGVAIATALMPPLCTAGYGLANGSLTFFFGGFYLFIINTIFIAATTLLVVRMLGYNKKEFMDPKREKKVTAYITAIVLITIIPSIFLAANLVQSTLRNQRIDTFLKNEFQISKNQILSKDIRPCTTKEGLDTLNLYILGRPLSEGDIAELDVKMRNYGINYTLKIHQDYVPENELDYDALRANVLKDLYTTSQGTIESKDKQIEVLSNRLLQLEKQKLPVNKLYNEAVQFQPLVTSLGVEQITIYTRPTNKQDTIHLALIGVSKDLDKEDRAVFSNWLKARIEADSVRLVILSEE